MTLRHMRIFLAVCENDCNVSRTAQALYLSQPAISQAINELEVYYGVRFFERISRRLLITEAGKRFKGYAVHICALFDEMEKGVHSWEEAGLVRVGASVTIGSQFLPAYVKAYQARYPDMEVQVRIGPSVQLEKMLADNTLDLALVEGEVHGEGLLAQPYMEDRLVGICARSGPFRQDETVPLKRFLQQKFLLREPGSGTRDVFDRALAAAGAAVQPQWEAMSTGALVNAVIQGLGVAVLPQRLVAGAVSRKRVCSFTVEGLDFRRAFQIVYHKDKFLSPSLRRLIELCKNYELDYPLPHFAI